MSRINKAGRITAIASFVIGTLILLIYLFTFDPDYAMAGFYFIMGAVIINLIVLGIVIFGMIRAVAKRSYMITTAMIVLNIPVVLLYIQFYDASNYMWRIRFHNATGKILQDVHVAGCYRERHLNKLAVNESFNCWYSSRDSCDITLHYTENGEKKYGLVTVRPPFFIGGEKMDFEIGDDVLRSLGKWFDD